MKEVIAPESCPSKRYVGGTSGYLCECTNPCKPFEFKEGDIDLYTRLPRKYLMLADNIAQDLGMSAYTVGMLARNFGVSTRDTDGKNLCCIDCGTYEHVESRESPAQEKFFNRCERCQDQRERTFSRTHS